jgi:hypothetical protein
MKQTIYEEPSSQRGWLNAVLRFIVWAVGPLDRAQKCFDRWLDNLIFRQ